jgi:hypothetical protein
LSSILPFQQRDHVRGYPRGHSERSVGDGGRRRACRADGRGRGWSFERSLIGTPLSAQVSTSEPIDAFRSILCPVWGSQEIHARSRTHGVPHVRIPLLFAMLSCPAKGEDGSHSKGTAMPPVRAVICDGTCALRHLCVRSGVLSKRPGANGSSPASDCECPPSITTAHASTDGLPSLHPLRYTRRSRLGSLSAVRSAPVVLSPLLLSRRGGPTTRAGNYPGRSGGCRSNVSSWSPLS